jgi:hypothetical protein
MRRIFNESSCKGKSVSDMLNPRLGQIIGLENCPDQGVYPSRKKEHPKSER